MLNLYILTEERPKINVLEKIFYLYSVQYEKYVEYGNIEIKPIIEDNKFTFKYKVENVIVEDIFEIFIKIVSGKSSFVDYLIFEQETEPIESSDQSQNNLLFLVEETKTDDSESRNTGVYQRMSKFVYADYFYNNVLKIMLYNIQKRKDKKPSDTSIFGTKIMKTLGVVILGKNVEDISPFKTIDELISFKNNMRKPPKGNVPIVITKYDDKIEISGRLSKPKDAGNIGHDPNIGALTSISKTLRILGWDKDIIITKHGVKQEYIDKLKQGNKFLSIAAQLNLKLDGLNLDLHSILPEKYWYYERKSEKVGSIFVHLQSTYKNEADSIYENHAGCERGYFYDKDNNPITIPKKNAANEQIYIPDLILKKDNKKEVLILEAKQSSTLEKGLKEIKLYDIIEKEYINNYYPGYSVSRWVITYGKNIYNSNLNDKVLFHLNTDGRYVINQYAPHWFKDLFNS
ncbi:MAG: hypothetical protein PUA60_00055 [Methanobacteriaceae archaeon]|nr:hypothetical protein [Methanobacteriaceae archaeon]